MQTLYAPLLDNPHERQGIGEPEMGTSIPKGGMEVCAEIYSARARSGNPARVVPALCRPVPETHLDTYNLALEFMADCASFEGYGHALPDEVRHRAARILANLRPK